jgi:hypothetical protein
MGVIKGSLISINEKDTTKIEDLKVRDNVLSLTKDDGLLNYKYSGKSIQLSHTDINFEYSKSFIHHQWQTEINRLVVINGKLKITLDHVICVYRDNKYIWDYVKSLEIGDKLIKKDFELEEIVQIDEKDEPIQIYSLSLRGYYNYLCDGYLLHNSGVCEQDLSFNTSSSIISVSLPPGSCAYCGIENKFLWTGAISGWGTATGLSGDETRLALPPVRYLTDQSSYGADGTGVYNTYLEMPRQWYDTSQLYIPNAVSGLWYYVYLGLDGKWTKSYHDDETQTGTGQNNIKPPTSLIADIYPHDFAGLFNDGSDGVNSNSSVLAPYHQYCEGSLWLNWGDDEVWYTYGNPSSTDGIFGSQTGMVNSVNRVGKNTLPIHTSGQYNGLPYGNDLNKWSNVKLCFSSMKNVNNGRAITASLNGTSTVSISNLGNIGWRPVNLKGGELNNRHPYSGPHDGVGPDGGYYAGTGDTTDAYFHGYFFREVGMQLA